MADRLLLSEALEQVKRLIDAFPNGGANAGKGYVGALASALAEYPRVVAMRCCDPTRGVARETRFLPTVADVIGWCERATDDMRGPVDREDRDLKMRAELERRIAEDRALQDDRANRPTLEELKQKHGPNWGMKTVDPANPQARENARVAMERANRMLHERECIAAGMDPASNVSAALVKVLREQGAIPRHVEAAE